ncbi:MAG: putative ATP-dependent endonuclease of OLD family [Rubritalea sp.]|jgi:predicted ATP-dependent endonuclease of OLD family
MQLHSVKIKNFRGYNQETAIPLSENITGVVGRNDSGKSSVLEALDIFFEGGEIKIDKDDICKFSGFDDIEITCEFENLPDQILIDENVSTSLTQEHLVSEDGRLVIKKRYKKASNKPEIIIVARHPTATNYKDILSLKITELRSRGGELGCQEPEDQRVASQWRQAIWNHAPDLELQEVEIDTSKLGKEAKEIGECLLGLLPSFALFCSDRENKDDNPAAKNPLKAAVNQAVAELKTEIQEIHDAVERKVIERTALTLEKLSEMDADLAASLTPKFKKKPTLTWDFSIEGDDEIPINKRGSGVRRLILLNFFRSEAERKVEAHTSPSVIYAFEEPETSQHPSNQEMLIRSLIEISNKENHQVLVTTHVPALAGLLPQEGLRFIDREAEAPVIRYGDDDTLEAICSSLGVLPEPFDKNTKGLILVEGPGDVTFLKHTSEMLKASGHIDTTLEEIGIFPMIVGGCGNLKHFVAKRLADQFEVPWAILLDSDLGTDEHGQNVSKIEALRAQGKVALLTRKREPENYLLKATYEDKLSDAENPPEITDECDAKKLIGAATQTRAINVMEHFWLNMNAEMLLESCKYNDDGEDKHEFIEMMNEIYSIV